MVSSSGTSQASYHYDPYGRTLNAAGTLGTANVMQFSSKPWVAMSGGPAGLQMYYYGFRFYDPWTQRWPNRDPIGEAGGLNLYEYVGNNPVNFYDPYGLAIGDWWDARTYFNSGFTESWSDSANSIGQALGGAAAGNWDQVANAYDSGVFGQTQDADPFTYYGTRAAVGTAAAATTAAVAIESAAAAAPACKKLKDNLHFDGPKWNSKDPTTGRIGQLRWGNTPLIRLDYHRLEPGGDPVLHLNIGPDGIHIPLWGGGGPSVWQ